MVDASKTRKAPKAREAPAEPKLSKRERIAARERAKQSARRHERAVKRLAAVEDEIRQHEEQAEQLSWRLGDPEMHRDPDALREIEAQREQVQGAIDERYREWERLAAEIEAAQQVGSGGETVRTS